MVDWSRRDPDPEWVQGVKDRLTAARDAKGISQNQLAEKIDVSSGAVSLRMTGSDLREWWALAQMAAALGASADELLGLAPSAAIVPVEATAVEDLMTHIKGAVRAAEALAKVVRQRTARGSRAKKTRRK